ncbi:undecaprenyl-diphosphate phosphatase [Haloechinothrix sp. YIM 98757]|uniref:Undecaprenyl-diphosphatase n=1 Tax=Haloechinothrix aidingensis TaxID=2752311 RepID=A0A838A9U6_9PSEU|nr:undecaprenyl-diphosphate phosphatase [Haloechinothrix aidingensis]
MDLLVAALLGVVQGVFMFVPVSSTSHLVLTQSWLTEFGVDVPPPESPEMVLFDLVVHVGTMVSVVVVMGAGLRQLGKGVHREVVTGRVAANWRSGFQGALATRLVFLGLITTAVTGVLGLLLKDTLTERVFASTTVVAVALVLTGAMLWWTDAMTPDRGGRWLRFGWAGPRDITLLMAIAIGVAQAAALAPGISRSGTTIFVALLIGMGRTMAARYSFYVAIPTILAATGVELLGALGDGGLTEVSWAAMATGFVVAAVVGSGALWVVLRLLEAAKFRVFAVYVWLLAVFVLVTGVS